MVQGSWFKVQLAFDNDGLSSPRYRHPNAAVLRTGMQKDPPDQEKNDS